MIYTLLFPSPVFLHLAFSSSCFLHIAFSFTFFSSPCFPHFTLSPSLLFSSPQSFSFTLLCFLHFTFALGLTLFFFTSCSSPYFVFLPPLLIFLHPDFFTFPPPLLLFTLLSPSCSLLFTSVFFTLVFFFDPALLPSLYFCSWPYLVFLYFLLFFLTSPFFFIPTLFFIPFCFLHYFLLFTLLWSPCPPFLFLHL